MVSLLLQLPHSQAGSLKPRFLGCTAHARVWAEPRSPRVTSVRIFISPPAGPAPNSRVNSPTSPSTAGTRGCVIRLSLPGHEGREPSPALGQLDQLTAHFQLLENELPFTQGFGVGGFVPVLEVLGGSFGARRVLPARRDVPVPGLAAGRGGMASNPTAATGEGESQMSAVTHGHSSDCGMNSSGTSRSQTRGCPAPSDPTSQSAGEHSTGRERALLLHDFNWDSPSLEIFKISLC